MYTDFYTDTKNQVPVHNQHELASIKYMIIDVDGTMTDGGIYYDEHGNELKKFQVKDATGFFTAKICGIQTIVVTGRECEATRRRLEELQVGLLAQGIVDKESYLKEYMREHRIKKEEIAYIGDDLNDYAGMQMAGFVACPQNAVDEIKEIADYISPVRGGEGAVRDAISYILKARGQWERAIEISYGVKTMR